MKRKICPICGRPIGKNSGRYYYGRIIHRGCDENVERVRQVFKVEQAKKNFREVRNWTKMNT